MERTLPPYAAHPNEARRSLNFYERPRGLLRETFTRWQEIKAPRLGAALAYYTVISLAPLLIIAILIAGAIFGQAAAQERIIGQIGHLMGPQGAAGVASLIAQRSFPGQAGTLATVVSVLTLILGAIGVFGQLQDAFDTVWDVTPQPSKGIAGIVQKRVVPFGMVLAVGFLLLVALLVNTVLAAISSYLGPYIPYFGLIDAVLNIILPLVVTTLLFAALFKFVPDVRLAWRDLWPGAALTAVLFTVGKIAIGVYLGHSSLASASGAAGSLLVVLVWVYYSAQILLFGAVFTNIYVRHQGRKPLPAYGTRSQASASPLPGQGDPAPIPSCAERPAALRTVELDRPPRPGCLVALLGFAAGLGAGVIVALRNRHAR